MVKNHSLFAKIELLLSPMNRFINAHWEAKVAVRPPAVSALPDDTLAYAAISVTIITDVGIFHSHGDAEENK